VVSEAGLEDMADLDVEESIAVEDDGSNTIRSRI
jgi:hypothetical protein